MELGNEGHGREGVDASEAAKGPDDLRVGGRLARLLDVDVQGAQPFLDMLDGEEVVLEDDLVRDVLEA